MDTPPPSTQTPNRDERRELLLHMYDQMFDDIKTQFTVVWESVAVLGGTIAALALVEKEIIPLDMAISLIVLVAAWLVAHVYNASYWYNRNLVIIANIERLFLQKADLRHVHYYFGKHRAASAMVTHLKIQRAFAVTLALLVLAFHFTKRVVPGLDAPLSALDPVRSLPYLVAIGMAVWICRLRTQSHCKYSEFIKNSPGIDLDASGIHYGVGHPTAK